jgi:hypothetical protein
MIKATIDDISFQVLKKSKRFGKSGDRTVLIDAVGPEGERFTRSQ